MMKHQVLQEQLRLGFLELLFRHRSGKNSEHLLSKDSSMSDRSTPFSFMTLMARSFMPCFFVPAEKTLNLSPQYLRQKPSAICERQEFPVQRNIIFFINKSYFASLRMAKAPRVTKETTTSPTTKSGSAEPVTMTRIPARITPAFARTSVEEQI